MTPGSANPSVLLLTCGSWHLSHTAAAFQRRDALAGLWVSDKNRTKLPPGKFRRGWPFHALLKPFYHLAPQILTEKAFYAFFPIWRSWVRQQAPPDCNVVQAIMGFATEAFDIADRQNALKVIDCQNSHPTTYYGYWQRECDLWSAGHRVPIPRWMFARMNREIERADVVLCPSNFVRDTMVLNGVPASRCFVNPFGVDLSIFTARNRAPAKPRFISVGTICLRKGHYYLFRAFEKVKRVLPDAELICVGDYKSDFDLERSRWEGTFKHIPHLGHGELAALFQDCTAFVLASIEEGFARVISEAMGAGLPIVATYESGASTQVSNGVEGYVVASRQPEALADRMIAIAQDRVLNESMGRAAHSKGGAGNSWQDYGDRLLAEYRRRLSPSDHSL